MRVEIAALRPELAAEFGRRNEIEARSLRRATFAGLSARELLLSARAVDNRLANIADPDFPDDLREDSRNALQRQLDNFRLFATVYTDAIAQIAIDQGEAVEQQADLLVRNSSARAGTGLFPR